MIDYKAACGGSEHCSSRKQASSSKTTRVLQVANVSRGTKKWCASLGHTCWWLLCDFCSYRHCLFVSGVEICWNVSYFVWIFWSHDSFSKQNAEESCDQEIEANQKHSHLSSFSKQHSLVTSSDVKKHQTSEFLQVHHFSVSPGDISVVCALISLGHRPHVSPWPMFELFTESQGQ